MFTKKYNKNPTQMSLIYCFVLFMWEIVLVISMGYKQWKSVYLYLILQVT